jgi:hypothetical protein
MLKLTTERVGMIGYTASCRQGGYPHAERMDGLGFVKL